MTHGWDGTAARAQAASAAVERLEALNPNIWAYFASLDFPGGQVNKALSSPPLFPLRRWHMDVGMAYMWGLHLCIHLRPPHTTPRPHQTVDVLVDTGSAGMGVPVAKPANWTEPGFVALDTKTAGAEIVQCQDPRCR